MNRKLLYRVFIGVVAALVLMIIVFSKKQEDAISAEAPPHRGTYAMSSEWLNTAAAIEGLKAGLKENPDDIKIKIQLAQAYIQEGRNTGDHAFYDKAVLELTEEVLKTDAVNFEALCCKGTVLLSQHHFSEALETAEKARNVNPSSAFVYGMMVDAYVELGQYDKAVESCDRMVAIRPDIRSYARVSYLREIYGDLPGAIQAMKLAVSAGYVGLEQTEWCRTQLGRLYEQTGSPDSARYCYELALYNRADYAFALAGLARVEKFAGNYANAISLLDKANKQITEFSFYEELCDLHKRNGNVAMADSALNNALSMLGNDLTTDESVAGHGHYADRELALLYIKQGNNSKAIEHAIMEYKRRPDNIDIQETLAWVYYKAGYYYLAEYHMRKAMRTGRKNPESMIRAGLIRIKAGQPRSGRQLIADAIKYKSIISSDLEAEISAQSLQK